MTWEDWNEDEEKRVIPKIPGNRFLMENWNAGFCACFEDTPEDYCYKIRENLIKAINLISKGKDK